MMRSTADRWQLLRVALMGWTCLALAWPAARAADPAANELQSIDVQALPGKQMQLTLHMKSAAPQPLSFTIDKPARISLDLGSAALTLPSRRIDVRSNGLDSVLAAEANGRVRVVLNLDALQPYQTTVRGNDIVVRVGADGMAATAAASAPAAAPAAATTAVGTGAASNSARGIRSIDFRGAGNGTGQLIVRLTDPRTPINLRQQGSQILVDFTGADVPANLVRHWNTMDFATPVSSFDVTRSGNDTHLVLSTNGEIQQLAYQSDDQYVIEVQRAVKSAQELITEAKVYTGEKIRLNFQDVETRAVLLVLADTSGKNIAMSESVTGNVTLRLQDVPWDQALDIVMQAKGLDKREQGNVIWVAPADELAAREKAKLEALKSTQDLAPLRTETFQINYAKASDIASLLKGGSTSAAGGTAGGAGGAPASSGNGNSMLSTRGGISVDERTNMLLVSDTSDKLAEVRRLVQTLDIPIRQVLIESRIVIVSDNFSRDLGVRAGLTNVQRNGNDGLYMTSGTSAAVDKGLSSAISNLGSTGSVFPVGISTGTNAADRYNINLPVASPAGNLAFMVLGSDYVVDLELSAAQNEGNGEIVSAPRIVTQNQKEAIIRSGTEIPYQQAAGGAGGGTTVQFKDAVLQLRVTPLITPDGNVILDLAVNKDSVGAVVVTSGGVNVPSIDTRALEATVMVGDGETVVLGGILETEARDAIKKVPYLGDIPILGHLFKSTSKTNNKKELLIFVTPKILREGVSVN
jgi:type IV pilus assembly protein PilQ